MKLRIKSIIALASMAMVMGGAVGIGAFEMAQDSKVVEASTDVLNTSDGNVLYLAYWNDNGWTSANARIFAYFWNSNNTSERCTTSTWINQDVNKYYHDSDNNTTAYFIYPSDTSHKYNRMILYRCYDTTTTFTTANVDANTGYWNKTGDLTLSSSFNAYGPTSYGANCNYVKLDNINVSTKSGTIYLRDKHSWSDKNAKIQVHVWGNTQMEGERYFNVDHKWIQGRYDNGNAVEGLLEINLPGNGAWRWIQFKRLNPADDSVWNQTGDYSLQNAVSKNAFETSSIDSGSFLFNVSDSERVNMFARYVLDQTASRCTSQYYNVNTKSDFETAWGNIETQYDYMSAAHQGTFWTATAGDANDLARGALRYDYLVHKYGMEDFVKRVSGHYSYYGAYAGASSFVETVVGDNKNIIIMTIASLTLISVAGLFFLKKKRA